MRVSGDHVRLNDVVFFAHLGVSEAERQVGQRIHIDVDLEVDLERASQSDDLHDTVNYEAVFREISRVVEGSRHRLLESLAGSLARALLAGFPAQEVRIRVRKPSVPFAGSLSSAEVEMVRRR
jgi:7,8-dihydroneopterin aldolase/epimerase/oxygenase